MVGRVALVDADIILYRVCWAGSDLNYHVYLEGEEEYGYLQKFKYKKDMEAWINGREGYVVKQEATPKESWQLLKSSADSMIESIIQEMQCTEIQLYLTPSSTFRDTVAADYKAHRTLTPAHKEEIRRHLTTAWSAREVPEIEADDALGIAHYQDPGNSVICSIDKDLYMIPGKHYNFVTKTYKEVTSEEARDNFFRQMLTGDSTDNIAGIKGIGKKTADKLLSGAEDKVGLIHAQYKKYYQDRCISALNTAAKLLWILRDRKDIKLLGFDDIVNTYLESETC